MDKRTFISEIAQPLKELGYRKNKNYWYKSCNDLTYCISIQGSQWSSDDYYVEIGIVVHPTKLKNPTLLHWYFRHRCKGANGEKNILPNDLLGSISTVFERISSVEEMEAFLREYRAVKVAFQYWF